MATKTCDQSNLCSALQVRAAWRINRPLALSGIFCLSMTLFDGCATNTSLPHKIMDSAYGLYDARRACWMKIHKDPFLGNERAFCMNIDSSKEIHTKAGNRWLLLATGDTDDDRAAHGTPGLVGAFLAGETDGDVRVLASDPQMSIGQMGQSPKNWKLLELGPNDLWGWANEQTYCYQGNCWSDYHILIPRGSRIVDIGGFSVSENLESAMPAEETNLSANVAVDQSATQSDLYFLRVTVAGSKEGKQLVPKTWVFKFDQELGRYAVPSGYPLSSAAH